MPGSVALVSILCRDRIGLVSAIADHLFEAGINLRDTTFAVLGKGAEFTSVCELPEGITAKRLEGELRSLAELEGAEVRVVPYGFDAAPGPTGKIRIASR
jgi:glycine cleavage system transcriptional repressor